MTITHTALFKFKPGTTIEQVSLFSDGLKPLPAKLPQIRSYSFGPTAIGGTANFDFAVVATFDDMESYLSYAEDPDHKANSAAHLVPILETRATVQFES